jgi:hypothetical protein
MENIIFYESKKANALASRQQQDFLLSRSPNGVFAALYSDRATGAILSTLIISGEYSECGTSLLADCLVANASITIAN